MKRFFRSLFSRPQPNQPSQASTTTNEAATKDLLEEQKKSAEVEEKVVDWKNNEVCTLGLVVRKEDEGSPLVLLVSDPMLFRYFCEEFVARDALVENLGECFAASLEEELVEEQKHGPSLAKPSKRKKLLDSLEKIGLTLSKEQERRKSVAIHGGVELIVSVLKTHKEDSKVCELCLSALWELALFNSACPPAALSMEIEPIISVMEMHNDVIGIQYQGCGALCNISVNKTLQAEVCSFGAVKTILNAMKIHSKSSSVLEHACWALRNISANVDSHKQKIIDLGGLEILLEALSGDFSTLNSSRACCSTLLNLSSNIQTVKKMIPLGYPWKIVDVMKKHPQDNRLQIFACGVLSNICIISEGQIDTGKAGGVSVIAAALKLLSEDGNYQKRALSALVNIGTNAMNKEAVSDLKIIEEVVSAMRKHKDIEEVQDYGCGSLWNASVSLIGTTKTKTELPVITSDAIEVIIEAMNNYNNNNDNNNNQIKTTPVTTSDSSGPNLRASGALLNFALNPQMQKVIGQKGGIEALVLAMKKHIQQTTLLEEAAGAIGNIAIDVENKKKIIDCGGIDIIVEIMKKHLADPGMQEMGCACIWNISTLIEIQEEIVLKGGIGSVLEAMRNHAVNLQVQERACGALRSLLSTEEALSTRLTPEIRNLMEISHRNHPESNLIRHSLETINRKVDPKVVKSIEKGVCSLVEALVCTKPCAVTEMCYCPQCCVCQRMFGCYTCDGKRSNLRYCQVCRYKCHSQHEGFWSFLPGSCQCKNTECKTTPKVNNLT